MTTTTLADGIAAFKARIDGVLSAAPSNGAIQIRSSFWGQGSSTERPVPHLSLQVLSFKKSGVIENNHIWRVTLKLRVTFPISGPDKALDNCVSYAEQIEDLIDGWLPTDGLEGGPGGEWALTIPHTPTHGNLGFMECEKTIELRTVKGNN